MPAKVLFLHSSDELYGSDRALLELVRRLNPGQFHPHVLLPADVKAGDLGQALTQSGVDWGRMTMPILRRRYLSPVGGLRFSAQALAGAHGLVRSSQRIAPELLHSNTGAVLGGAMLARRLGVPHIWHVRELVQHPVWVRKALARTITRASDVVIAVSQAVADNLLGDQPALAPRLLVLPDAVDAQRFSPGVADGGWRRGWGVGPADMLVGVVGRISAWKGQDFFLRAFARAARRNAILRAVIVGDVLPGDEQRVQGLQALARTLGVADKVFWPGYLDGMSQVMAALDVLALPSITPEPFGLVALEAMSSGKPVIATAHGGPVEVVSHGETGLLVSPDDPAEMAAALQLLAKRPQLRQKMGRAGRRKAVTLFSMAAYLRAVENLYKDLLSEKMG